jgi:Na+-transporting NADH:ubiquinone oxidoreductase subunit C
MQQHNVFYNLWFCTAVCIVSAVCVSVTAVMLKERQDLNAAQDKKRNVLVAAGLAASDESLSREEVDARFEPIHQVVIDLETGEELENVDPENFDQQEVAADPATSRPAPENRAKVQRLPNQALVYKVEEEGGKLQMLILPIEGKGLWSTLYGFLALDTDMNTIKGITFYEHGETPGLGGEVDNPNWKALWNERKAFDSQGNVEIAVIKGRAGPASEDPYRVDGISGATLTSKGVSYLVQFWLGESGFGPYIKKVRLEQEAD